MTNPSCLIDLKHILPQNSWPQVIAALRQDSLIWNALQNPDFRGLAISKLGSHPEKWTPAQLALLALKRTHAFTDICTKSLSEIDPELRVQAIQTYELHTADSPPQMDLAAAGLLMLALLEHYRLTHSWERIPQSEHWKTPLACLFGCIEQPLALLLTIPASLTIHILSANPLDLEKRIQNFMGILVSAPTQQRLSILRNLAIQQPALSQHLARQLWKSSPPSNRSQMLTENVRGNLLTHFNEIHTLTTDLGNTLAQAEAQLNAGFGLQADTSLRIAWQASRNLQTILFTQFSQVTANLEESDKVLADWQTANIPLAIPAENTAALALVLLERNQLEAAQNLLSSIEGISHPLIHLAQAWAAYLQGNLETAREAAQQTCQNASNLEAYHALMLARILLTLKRPEKANHLLESLRQAHPNHIELAHLAAQAYAAVGQYPQAIQAIHLATALAPDQLDLLRDYAQIHEYFGQWPAALEARQATVETEDEPRIEDLRSLAFCALQIEQYQKAQETCLIALKRFPDDGIIFAILGETFLRKGHKEKAQEHFQSAILTAPEQAIPWLALGRAQQQAGDLLAASETLRKATLAAPEQAEIHLALGENYLEAGSITQALACLQRADQLAENYSAVECFHMRSLVALPLAKALFELGRAEEALQTIQTLSPLPAREAAQFHLHAQILLFLGRAQEALPLLAKALFVNPTDVSLGLDYARAQLESGNDPNKAIHTLYTLLESDRQNPEALALLAEALHANGNTTEALETYRQALATRLNEDTYWFPRLSIGLAKTAIELGQPETALAALQQAWQNNPQNLDVLQTLSEAYAAVHLNEQALQMAILARDTAPLSLKNLTWFANLMVTIKAYAEAAHALNCAIELAPHQANLRLRLGEIHQMVGDYHNAHQAIRLVAELDQASPQDLRLAATHLKALQHPEDAVICLRIAVRRCQDPSSGSTCGQILSELIDAYLQLELPSEALSALDEFIEHQPNNLPLLGQRALLLQQLGRDTEALSTLEKALTENPDCQPLQLMAVQLHYTMGNLLQARDHAQKAIDTFKPNAEDGSPLPALTLAADIADACLQESEAQEFLRHPLSEGDFSGDLEFYCLRAELALRMDEEIDAAQALTTALKLNPEHPRTLALQARLTARHGDSNSAQMTLQNALIAWGRLPKWEISSPVGLLALAEAALELHQWSTAIFMLQEAAEKFPQEPRVHLWLARGLVLRAEHQRLCETLRVTQHAPGAPAISEHAHCLFEHAVLTAAQKNDETQSQIGQALITHWRLRGQAIFQPSIEHACALAEIPHTVESRAALLAAMRHSRDKQISQKTALEAFSAEALHQKHKNRISINLMVQIALALGNQNPKKAVEAVTTALDVSIRHRHPSLPIFYAVQAYVAKYAGDEHLSIQALQNALKHWPDECGWHAWMAETLEKLPNPDFKTMIEHLLKANELDPKNGIYFLKLGQAYLQTDEYQSAFAVLEQAAQLLPKHPMPWLALARAYRLTGEFAQLFQNAARAAEMDPRIIEPHLLMAETAIEIGSPQKALEYCQAALKINSQHPQALLLQARALDLTGQSPDALRVFDQALASMPKSILLMLEHAQITQRAMGEQAAVKSLNRLAEEYPDDSRVLALLAEMMIESNQPDPAVQVAQKALHSNQGDLDCTQEAHLLQMLGRMMRRNGQLDQAIQYLSEAIQCNPDAVESYIELGRSYEERRQYAEALDAFHQAIATTPGDFRAYYHAGQVFKATKDYAAAEDMLKRAAKLAPNDLGIRRQLGGLVALNLVHNPKEGADLYVD